MRVANPASNYIKICSITPEFKAEIIALVGDKSAYISDYVKRLIKEDIKRKRGDVLPPSTFKRKV